MKITKEKLNKIIKEEIEAVIIEGMFSRLKSKMGFGSKETTAAIDKAWKASTAVEKLAKEAEEAGDMGKYELVSAYDTLKKLLDRAAKAVAETGLDGTQKMRYKSLRRAASLAMDTMSYEITYAIDREEGAAAAEAAKDQLRRDKVAAEKSLKNAMDVKKAVAKKEKRDQYHRNAADKEKYEKAAAERDERERNRVDTVQAGNVVNVKNKDRVGAWGS
jgi:hypothetical protein